jgi:hypothetical protein
MIAPRGLKCFRKKFPKKFFPLGKRGLARIGPYFFKKNPFIHPLGPLPKTRG